jgi:AraC-like DNA-binding protein
MSVAQFDPDKVPRSAVALRIDVQKPNSKLPFHQLRKAQLILTMHGSVTCEAPRGLWIVPPRCGIWIPSGISHNTSVSPEGRVCVLFVDPAAARLPTFCCTLKVSPLLRELVQRLADLPPLYPTDGPVDRLVAVLLDELAQAPTKQLHLPISTDSRLRQIANALLKDPSDRSTMAEWARRVAMSERTLARLIHTETGMTFGHWRQQFHIIMALQRLSLGKPVQAVSQDLGYESVSAFITMFKKALGKSPGRYLAERGEMLADGTN